MAQRTPEAADRSWQAKDVAAGLVWEKFGETTEEDYRLASKTLLQTNHPSGV